MNEGLTLDFDEWAASFPTFHYCFCVDRDDFTLNFERINAAGILYRSTPYGPVDRQINTQHGGSVVYWNETDGHV